MWTKLGQAFFIILYRTQNVMRNNLKKFVAKCVKCILCKLQAVV